MMMSIIRSMIKTLLRKQKFRERDEKTNFSLLLLLLCLSFYVLRRSTTKNERRQTDILSSSSSSLFLPRTHERTFTRRRSQEDKQKKMLFARSRLNVLFSKFLRAQKRAFEFRFAQKCCCPLFSLSRKIAAFPFVGPRM